MTHIDRWLISLWCRLFQWDAYQYEEVVQTYGIRFRFKGRRYIILPGSTLWILLMTLGAVVGVFLLWATCFVLIVAAP